MKEYIATYPNGQQQHFYVFGIGEAYALSIQYATAEGLAPEVQAIKCTDTGVVYTEFHLTYKTHP
jgi:hypothetical protein